MTEAIRDLFDGFFKTNSLKKKKKFLKSYFKIVDNYFLIFFWEFKYNK